VESNSPKSGEKEFDLRDILDEYTSNNDADEEYYDQEDLLPEFEQISNKIGKTIEISVATIDDHHELPSIEEQEAIEEMIETVSEMIQVTTYPSVIDTIEQSIESIIDNGMIEELDSALLGADEPSFEVEPVEEEQLSEVNETEVKRLDELLQEPVEDTIVDMPNQLLEPQTVKETEESVECAENESEIVEPVQNVEEQPIVSELTQALLSTTEETQINAVDERPHVDHSQSEPNLQAMLEPITIIRSEEPKSSSLPKAVYATTAYVAQAPVKLASSAYGLFKTYVMRRADESIEDISTEEASFELEQEEELDIKEEPKELAEPPQTTTQESKDVIEPPTEDQKEEQKVIENTDIVLEQSKENQMKEPTKKLLEKLSVSNVQIQVTPDENLSPQSREFMEMSLSDEAFDLDEDALEVELDFHNENVQKHKKMQTKFGSIQHLLDGQHVCRMIDEYLKLQMTTKMRHDLSYKQARMENVIKRGGKVLRNGPQFDSVKHAKNALRKREQALARSEQELKIREEMLNQREKELNRILERRSKDSYSPLIEPLKKRSSPMDRDLSPNVSFIYI
jgi:hypothetical protein